MQQRLVSFQMPADPHAFISENKDRDFDGESPDTVWCGVRTMRLHLAIVEQVRDGTQLRVRLLLDDQHHQFVNLVSSYLHYPYKADIRSSLEQKVPEQAVEMTAHPPNHMEKR